MFGKLKELREYEGYTQEDIAKVLKVKRSTYAGWESGKDIIPFRKLNMLANFYHTTMDYLVGNSPTRKQVLEIQTIDTKVVSKNLREFRKSKGLTQKEFAEKITTSQTNIHKYENDKCLITTNYALEFSKQYNYSLDKLIEEKKNN